MPSARSGPRSTWSRAVAELDPALRARAGVLTGEAAVTLGAEGQGMVAGDLVNTASRDSVGGRARHRARRRGDEARDRGGDRLRGRGDARAEGQGRADAALPGAARDRRPRRRAALVEPGAAVRRPRPGAAPGQGALPRHRGRAAGPARLGRRRRRGRQVAPLLGVREVPGRARRGGAGGIAAAACRTAKASRTGRSRRWCGCAAGSPRTRRSASALAKLARDRSSSTSPTPRSGLGRAAARAPARPRGGRRRRPGEPVLRLARPVRAPGRASIPSCSSSRTCSGRTPALLDFLDYLLDWSRNHPIFVLSLARPELSREAPDLGRRKAGGHLALPRAAAAPGDGDPARRPRPRAARGAAQPDPRARGGCSALRGRDGADAARPRSPRARRDRVPARPARSRRWRCPRHCTPSSPRGWTGSPPRNGASSRAPRCSARRSPSRGSPRSPASPTRSSTRCSPRCCGRRCSRSRPIPARPSAASTRSSRTSSSTSRTRRSPSASARTSTSLPRGTWRRVWGAPRRTRSSKWSPRTTSMPGALRPEADDADEIKGTAREMLVRAAERASSLGATAEAQRAFERAIELAEDAAVEADLHERAGIEAWAGARADDAIAHFEAAIAALRERLRRAFGGACVGPACRDHVGAREARGRDREPGELVRGASRGRAGRGARDACGAARAVQFLRRRFRRSAGADRDRARSRRGAAPARGPLAGPEHEGRDACIARPSPGGDRARSARAPDRAGGRTSRPPRCGPTTTSRTSWCRRTATRKRDQLLAEGIAYARRVGNRQWERTLLCADLRRLRPRQVGQRGRACGRADRPSRSPTRGSGSRR